MDYHLIRYEQQMTTTTDLSISASATSVMSDTTWLYHLSHVQRNKDVYFPTNATPVTTTRQAHWKVIEVSKKHEDTT